MREKITAKNFYERGILFNLNMGTYQGRKKLSKGVLNGRGLPAEIVRGVHDIFENEFTKLLKNIMSYDCETRAAVAGKGDYEKGKRFTAVDFPVRGVYYVLGEDVEKVINYINRRKAEREELIKEPADQYNEAIGKFKEQYPKFYKAAEGSYPTREEFVKRFYFEFQLFQMQAPSKQLNFISPALYKDTVAKINSTVDAVKQEVVNIVYTELLNRAKQVVSQCNGRGGKPNQKTLNGFQKIFNRIEEAYADFIDRDDLFAAIAKIKEELTGIEAKKLRDNDSLRRKFKKKMIEVSETLEALPDTEMLRAIEF